MRAMTPARPPAAAMREPSISCTIHKVALELELSAALHGNGGNRWVISEVDACFPDCSLSADHSASVTLMCRPTSRKFRNDPCEESPLVSWYHSGIVTQPRGFHECLYNLMLNQRKTTVASVVGSASGRRAP